MVSFSVLFISFQLHSTPAVGFQQKRVSSRSFHESNPLIIANTRSPWRRRPIADCMDERPNHPRKSSYLFASKTDREAEEEQLSPDGWNSTATTVLERNDGDLAWSSSSFDETRSPPEASENVITGNGVRNPMATLQSRFFEPRVMGMRVTPEIVAIITIYFVEGALGLSFLAQTYLLKDEFGLGPAELSALTGLYALPWTIKPLYGFLSDGFPLFGYKRKSYLVLAGLLGCAGYGVLGLSSEIWSNLPRETALIGTTAAFVLTRACIAMSDVVIDGVVVTRTREAVESIKKKEQESSTTNAENAESDDSMAIAGSLQSLCWGSAAIGGLLSSYFSGSLLEVLPLRGVFTLTAVLPFLVAMVALFTDEERVVPASKMHEGPGGMQMVQEQLTTLWGAFKQSSIWKPALFLFLWQSTPTADGAFFFFLTNDLGFGPEFMGRVRLIVSAAGLVGVVLYNQFWKGTKIKDILYWSTIASFPLGLIPLLLITHVNRELGIPDEYLVYGDDVALAVLGQISFIPTLVLAARLCPAGVEAVLFATLMSIYNGASTVGTEVGALLTRLFGVTESNFDNLAVLTFVCCVTSLYPLLFIGWLDKVGDASEAEIEQDESL